jgi:hypothetical protein
VVFLASSESRAETIFGGEYFAAEQDGVSWVEVLDDWGSDHVRDQVFVRRQTDFRVCLETKLAKHEDEHELQGTMEFGRRGFLIKHPFAEFILGLVRHTQVFFDGDECGRAHGLILHLIAAH